MTLYWSAYIGVILGGLAVSPTAHWPQHFMHTVFFFYYWLLWCSLEPSLYAAHNAEVLVLVNKSFYCNCLLCFSEFLMGPNFVCILMICLLGESLIGVG